MEREYFCGGCGLFYWQNLYQPILNTGIINLTELKGCPNSECKRHSSYHSEIPVFAVDTMAFAYYCESHGEWVDQIKWSSPQHAPEWAIEVYKNQGIPIRN